MNVPQRAVAGVTLFLCGALMMKSFYVGALDEARRDSEADKTGLESALSQCELDRAKKTIVVDVSLSTLKVSVPDTGQPFSIHDSTFISGCDESTVKQMRNEVAEAVKAKVLDPDTLVETKEMTAVTGLSVGTEHEK